MSNEVMQRMEEYLTTGISAEDLALHFRRLKLEIVRMVLAADPDSINKDWIADGMYFLDTVSEILDPYLEKEYLE